MEGVNESPEVGREIAFSSVFDLEPDRFQDKKHVESLSGPNLVKVEQAVERDLAAIAARLGGEYVPPTAEEVQEKFAQTLAVNPFVFPSVDEDGRVWAVHKGSPCSNMDNCAAFNNSGLHGTIIFPQNREGEATEPVVRLYRGATIRVDQPQVAPLARVEGVNVQDLEDYRDGRITLEDILPQVADESLRSYLERTLVRLRESMEKHGTTESKELEILHTCFTPGALDWDLWVSASYSPLDTLRAGAHSVGNVYGDFCDAERGLVEGVMVLDVPESEVKRYSNQAGVFGQIRPEWVKAIVPQHTNRLEENVRRADQLMVALSGGQLKE